MRNHIQDNDNCLHYNFIGSVVRKLTLAQQGNYLFQAPNVLRDTRFHRGSDAQALVDSAEIVVHEVEGDCVFVVFGLL
jgi:hypothetical protein